MIRIAARSSHFRLCCRSLSDKSDKPDKRKEKAEKKEEKKSAEKTKPDATKARLNELLASMSTNTDLSIIKSVVTPPRRDDKRAQKEGKESKENKPENIEKAVKEVARELGGDTTQTESELLAKLLNRGGLSENLGLSALISGMKVDRNDKPSVQTKPPISRSEFVRRSIEREPHQDQRFKSRTAVPRRLPTDGSSKISGGSVNLFGERPLGIFTNIAELKESPDILSTWKRLQERELKLAITHPPSNYFQKMALWTEQGKLWKFPIDNEQGLDDEAKVCFTEHIFLDKHLEPWCPAKGPIRHFMELVCVGLSKNHYFSVQQKIEHIIWYRDYFEAKKDVLQKVIIETTPLSLEESSKEAEK